MCLCACAHAPCGRGTAVTGKHEAQNLLNRCNRGIDGSHMKSALEYVEMYQRTEGSQNGRVFTSVDSAGIGNTQPNYNVF